MKKAGDGGVSVILLDEDADGALVWRQARVFAERALGSAELDPGCAAALQRLLVRWEMRLRSISADKPKANARTLL